VTRDTLDLLRSNRVSLQRSPGGVGPIRRQFPRPKVWSGELHPRGDMAVNHHGKVMPLHDPGKYPDDEFTPLRKLTGGSFEEGTILPVINHNAQAVGGDLNIDGAVVVRLDVKHPIDIA